MQVEEKADKRVAQTIFQSLFHTGRATRVMDHLENCDSVYTQSELDKVKAASERLGDPDLRTDRKQSPLRRVSPCVTAPRVGNRNKKKKEKMDGTLVKKKKVKKKELPR